MISPAEWLVMETGGSSFSLSSFGSELSSGPADGAKPGFGAWAEECSENRYRGNVVSSNVKMNNEMRTAYAVS